MDKYQWLSHFFKYISGFLSRRNNIKIFIYLFFHSHFLDIFMKNTNFCFLFFTFFYLFFSFFIFSYYLSTKIWNESSCNSYLVLSLSCFSSSSISLSSSNTAQLGNPRGPKSGFPAKKFLRGVSPPHYSGFSAILF